MTDKEKRELKNSVISIFKNFNILDNTATIGGLRDDILRYINSLQEEHDEIVDKYLYGKEPELVDADDLPKEEPVSEELEDAASSFARKDSEGISNPANFYYTVADKTRIFKAGAKWQETKDKQILNEEGVVILPEEEFERMKRSLIKLAEKEQQMMAKAIDGIARPDDGEVWCDLKPFNFKDGDKVKIIVIKEN